ncbi:MAG: glycosyltransferase family 1 protein [Candidatus Poseidoniales archaeon]|nr:MAG: glycosyltransferase family 1 protein [Candidatus Poseidoniales archaeon]
MTLFLNHCRGIYSPALFNNASLDRLIGEVLHIAMISGEYPPRWGGMGSTVFHLSSKLAAMGHTISVITRSSKDTPPHLEGVRVIQVPWLKLPLEFTRSYGKSALRELTRIHAVEPVDVVHLHCPMASWSTKQFERCQREIAPVVSSMHGTWLGERDGLTLAARYGEPAVWANPNDIAIRFMAGRYARFEKSAIQKSAVIVPNSRATKLDLESRYDAPSDWDCEVIHWGVDTGMFVPMHLDSEEDSHKKNEIRSKYGLGPETLLLLAVGRLAARKGHGLLLRAFAVSAESTDSHLVIIGRGSLRGKLNRLASRLGISHRVTIESGMGFEQISEMYRISDLVIYPSYYEGQGLIPLEAMSSGTPVVTVNHGPLPEMVDESVGGLFEIGSVESLSESICHESSSMDSLLEKGREGRNRVLERFTLDGNAEDFLTVYRRAISQ